MKKLLIPILVLALGAGCMTQRGLEALKEARGAHADYLAQARTYPAMRITAAEGKELSFTISGAREITMDAPLNPLGAMPKDPDTIARIIDATKNTVLGGLGIWAMRDVATQAPTVIEQPTPLVVSEGSEIVTP